MALTEILDEQPSNPTLEWVAGRLNIPGHVLRKYADTGCIETLRDGNTVSHTLMDAIEGDPEKFRHQYEAEDILGYLKWIQKRKEEGRFEADYKGRISLKEAVSRFMIDENKLKSLVSEGEFDGSREGDFLNLSRAELLIYTGTAVPLSSETLKYFFHVHEDL